MEKYLIFDLSHWNDVSWNLISQQAYGVMLKLGQVNKEAGKFVKDSKFDSHYKNAVERGLFVGAYLYSTARNLDELNFEIQEYVQELNKYNFDLPIAMDFEYMEYSAEQLKQFVSVSGLFLENHGYYVSMYLNKSLYSKIENTQIPSRFDMWIADWENVRDWENEKIGMWQYTNRYKIGNVEVDANLAFKDYAKIIADNGLNRKKQNFCSNMDGYCCYRNGDKCTRFL